MRYLLLLCCAGLIFGQGTETKPKVEDYSVHAQAKNAAIGAEFTVHSYSRGEEMYVAKHFLVVEVAIFPPKGQTCDVRNADFSLRINGRKEPVDAETPDMAAQDVKHPEWKQPDGPIVEVGGAVNNAGVVLGGPPVNRNPFPGSPPPEGPPYPPTKVPRDNPSGVEKEPPDAAKLLLQTALVEGVHHGPVSGFLYFPFSGKVTAIKTLELLYQDAVLKLR